jgi:hypothetical protein
MTANQIIFIPDMTSYTFTNTSYLNYFRGTKFGTSDCNQYIPLHAVMAHELLTFDGGVKVLEYKTATVPSSYQASTFSRYDQFLSALLNGTYANTFKYSVAGETFYAVVQRGIIMDTEGEVLMCIGLEADYVMNTDLGVIRTTPNTSRCAVFMSNDYCNNPKYKNLKKKIDTVYVAECVALGMDIIQTEKIDKWLYRNNFSSLKFKTVTAQQKFLKEDIPKEMIKQL